MQILVFIDSTLLLNTVPFVFGGDPSKVTLGDVEHSFKFATIAEPFWAWAMCSIKVSVALMLLRLESGVKLRRFLWINIAIQILLALYNMFQQLFQCVPLEGAWDLLGQLGAKCWSEDAIRINLICVSSINIATDFLFAMMPINFLRKVNRPLRERATIGFLMALGSFAGVASILKAHAGTQLGRTDDQNREGIDIGMWSCIEESCGLIAACIPCLRQPVNRALKAMGVLQYTQRSNAHRYGQMRDPKRLKKSTLNTSSTRNTAIQLTGMRSGDAQSDENVLTNSQAKDGEIWCTTEVNLEEEQARPLPKGGRNRQDSRHEAWNDDEEVLPARPVPAARLNMTI